MNNSVVKIIMTISAAKITSRWNLRIRLSYACIQLVSPLPIGVRPNVPSSPLAVTTHFYQDKRPSLTSREHIAPFKEFKQSGFILVLYRFQGRGFIALGVRADCGLCDCAVFRCICRALARDHCGSQ
jgi:hypothetical protein